MEINASLLVALQNIKLTGSLGILKRKYIKKREICYRFNKVYMAK